MRPYTNHPIDALSVFIYLNIADFFDAHLLTGWFRTPSRPSQEIVKDALARVGMLELRSRQIGELSGEQQQRVFLARALAQQAELLFFDEPFVGVDKKTEAIIFDVFEELKSQGKILLVVTHDLGTTLTKCDQLLLLNKQIIANGSMKEVMTADNIQRLPLQYSAAVN